MAETLPDRLEAYAAWAATMRQRYEYRGNAKYPRAYPGPAWQHFDQLARDLRTAAAIIATPDGQEAGAKPD